MIFPDIDLAARIERAECRLLTSVTDEARARSAAAFARPLGGGVASFAGHGSPLNKVAGLGFGEIPPPGELEEMERDFARRECPVQVELSSLGSPAVGELLTGRGYRLRGFEAVLGRALPGSTLESPGGVVVTDSGADRLETWLGVLVEGFATPDDRGVPSHESFPADELRNAMRDLVSARGFHLYFARREESLAGGASMRLDERDRVAQLCGAATLPAHRRRGVQTALLARRLADASAAGCDLAVVTTQPGSTSFRNVQKQGFELLYVRAHLVLDVGSER